MNLDTILPLVKKPSQYVGNEFNRPPKNRQDAEVRAAFVFPDLYEIGMSHQGLQILYHIVNGEERFLAERAYAPDRDMEELLKGEKIPLFSIESKTPLNEFDFLGITLPYELCYANILTILDLAGLPFRAVERDETYPLVIGGGPCAFNPEPVADFFDAILLGDGEEAILEICEMIGKAKKDGASKQNILARLNEIPGLYVPSKFVVDYDDSENIREIRATEGEHAKVKRRILGSLDETAGIPNPLVPLTRIVHDRLGIEIARGCTRGCRFCQAGIIYRPVRERKTEHVMELAIKGIDNSGFQELALLSLSTGDYSCLSSLIMQLMDTFVQRKVSVSMPSMRVGTLTPEIMEQVRRVRKTGFTVAPEAGSERLRRVINKGITEEDLLATCKAAFELGWRQIKFYFMVGLPTETEQDIEAIAELAHKALQASSRSGRITVSVGTFVPKAHTPFQRERQLPIEESFAKIDMLKERLKKKAFRLKWHDPRQSFLEGVMARGDRRLSGVIERAWRLGARLDGWSDHFDLDIWRTAASECGIELDGYLRKREKLEILPWQHLDTGVDEVFLADEYEKGVAGDYTPDCRVNGCQKCGLCDFKTIRPVTHHKSAETPVAKTVDQDIATSKQEVTDDCGNKKSTLKNEAPLQKKPRFVYRINYSRTGDARFLSHLEMIQMFFRVFQNTGLPLNFSQGFNPSPKVSFSPALPLGTESNAEYLFVDLYELLPNQAEIVKGLNRRLPEGFEVTSMELGGLDGDGLFETCYEIGLPGFVDIQKVNMHQPGKPIKVSLIRKGKRRELDAGPMVKELEVLPDGKARLVLLNEPGKAGVKPLELMAAILGHSFKDLQTARVLKVWSKKIT